MRESDFLKRYEVPYMTKGRWYRAFIESDGSSYHLTQCDLSGCVIRNGHLAMPNGFHILDTVYDIQFDTDTAIDVDMHLKCYSNGKQALPIPTQSVFTDMYVYFYGYQAEPITNESEDEG